MFSMRSTNASTSRNCSSGASAVRAEPVAEAPAAEAVAADPQYEVTAPGETVEAPAEPAAEAEPEVQTETEGSETA